MRSTLDDLVGQAQLRQGLRALAHAARREKRPLDHILLIGARGMGKAAFARAAAHERGVRLIAATIDALNDPVELVRILTNMPIHGVLLVEDVAYLSREAGQVLARFVTEPEQQVLAHNPLEGRSVPLRLAPFSFIGTAETLPTIPADVHQRVKVFMLEPYTRQELMKIIQHAATAANVTLERGAAELMALYAEGRPVNALNIFQRLRRHVPRPERISLLHARQALTEMGYP